MAKNFLAALACLFALMTSTSQAQENVVAIIGSKKITKDEFNKRYDDVRKQAVNPPSRKIFLEDLVRYEVGIQEAEKRNLAKDPQVAERLRQELYKGMIEKDLGHKIAAITISEPEMKEYYKDNPELRTSHILFEIKPSATPAERAQAKKRAEEIYAEVKGSSKPFEQLVSLYSDDVSTKKNGGDVGFQTRVSVVPSYYEAAVRLKIGEISPVVETAYGFHIIKLTARNSYTDANKKHLRAAIFEKKRLAMFNDYFDRLKKQYKIVTNPDAVK